MATNLAISQVFCANLTNNTALVGFYQGAYGIGGITGPLVATALVSHGFKWSRFYIIELCLAFFNLMFSAWAFWKYERESETSDAVLPALAQNTEHTSSRKGRNESANRKWQSFKTLISNKPTVLGALFIFCYQGAEVAISGWIISFLIQFRHGDPSKVGFVTSGFWAGITLGRFTLSFLAHRIGERPSVFLFTAGALHPRRFRCHSILGVIAGTDLSLRSPYLPASDTKEYANILLVVDSLGRKLGRCSGAVHNGCVGAEGRHFRAASYLYWIVCCDGGDVVGFA
jgi:MFS family permease